MTDDLVVCSMSLTKYEPCLDGWRVDDCYVLSGAVRAAACVATPILPLLCNETLPGKLLAGNIKNHSNYYCFAPARSRAGRLSLYEMQNVTIP